MSPTVFTYSPIDLNRVAVRLVRLLAGDPDDPSDSIACELFESFLDLEKCVPYEALSYTWGSAAKSRVITINGQTAFVTRNLHNALWRLRDRDEDRILWIDAICINQDDFRERGHQVGHMRKIYNNAERVLIWLGLAFDDMELFMDNVQKLHKQTLYNSSEWRCAEGRKRIAEEHLGATGSILYNRHLNALRGLHGRDWFRRVWILQEVTSARAATVLCGWKKVSARTFALVPSLMGIQPDSHVKSVLDIIPGQSRAESWWSRSRDLHTLLLKFRGSQATDPRDKVFALLGIASDSADHPAFQADYTKEAAIVEKEIMSFIIFRKILNGSDYAFPDLEAFSHAPDEVDATA